MADLGRELISKVVGDDDIQTALTAGIRASWFEDQEHRKVWLWCIDYFQRYGETPTERALKSQFPNYRLLKVNEPYEFYLDHFKQQRETAIVVDAVIEANEALDHGDSKKAQQLFAAALTRLGTEVSVLTEYDVVDALIERLDTYRDVRRNRGKLTGISSGWPTLDLMTGGYQPSQFWVYGGQQKHGKSFLLLKSATVAQDHGWKALFVSFEMTFLEQAARYDGICAGVNATNIMTGRLTNEDLRKIRKAVGVRKNLPPLIIAEDISATTTISGLAARIEQHKPDIVFVDGIYLMEDESGNKANTPQAYTAISRGLKRLAQRTKLPIVCTTQALPSKMDKSGAITLYSLAYTSAWGMDADLILGVEKFVKNSTIKLRVTAGRNVSTREIVISCNWNECLFEEVDLEEEDDDDA